MGITNILKDELIKQDVSEDKANQHFYIMDKQGLLFDDMDDLTEAQQVFAKNRNEFSNTVNWKNLKEVIENIKPTVLIGTSTRNRCIYRRCSKRDVKTYRTSNDFPIV